MSGGQGERTPHHWPHQFIALATRYQSEIVVWLHQSGHWSVAVTTWQLSWSHLREILCPSNAGVASDGLGWSGLIL